MGYVSCMGLSDPFELLELQGFQRTKGKFKDFRHKRVLDFGAGVSDFTNVLLEHSKPTQVIAVDPLYESEEKYSEAITLTLEGTLREISALEVNGSPEQDKLLALLERRRNRLQQPIDRLHNRRIRKLASIHLLGGLRCDYIFLTDVISLLSNTLDMLADFHQYLSKDGRLLITESHSNIESTPQAMQFLDTFHKGGVPGISARGHNATHIGYSLDRSILKGIYDMRIAERNRVS